jgi:hypothetical protein
MSADDDADEDLMAELRSMFARIDPIPSEGNHADDPAPVPPPPPTSR